jgi:hypothetical protein
MTSAISSFVLATNTAWGPTSSPLSSSPNPAAAVNASAPSIAAGGSSSNNAASRQLQDALQALKTLSQQPSSSSSGIKAAAKQRLDELKSELKNLQLLGGDPKQRAQEAARIAREIAAAVKAYAQAGGTSNGSDPAASSSAPSAEGAGQTQSGDASTASATTAGADDPSIDAAATDASAADASAAATAQTGDPSTLAASPAAQGAGQYGAQPSQGASTPTTPAPSGSSSDDQKFLQEAKDLANQANSIIKTAAQALQRHHKTLPPGTSGSGDAALAVVDKAADELGGSSAESSIATPPASTTAPVAAAVSIVA